MLRLSTKQNRLLHFQFYHFISLAMCIISTNTYHKTHKDQQISATVMMKYHSLKLFNTHILILTELSARDQIHMT